MQDSIFTKIIKGEIPCHKVYEDKLTLAFLDIEPFFPGHTLVVPKKQVDQFDELPAQDYQALMATVRKVSKHVRTVLGAQRCIVQVLGFDVPHAHVHVMPADTAKQFFQAAASHLSEAAYSYQPTSEELTAMAARLRMQDEL